MRISRIEGGLTGLATPTKNGSLPDTLKCPETKTSCHRKKSGGGGGGGGEEEKQDKI